MGNTCQLIRYTAESLSFSRKLIWATGREDATLITGAPSIATNAIPASPVGSYPITISKGSLTAANYSFVFINGTLAVGLASQSIAFDALAAKTYGDIDFDLGASGGGSGNPVTFTSSNTAVATISGITVTITGAGSATITASQAGSGSYASATAQQTLTVTKAPLTVTADNQNRPYNTANPALTISYAGFVKGENATVLSGTSAIATTADIATPVGSYPITVAVGNLFSNNYSFSYVHGALTISKASATVGLGSLSATYDGTPKSASATTMPSGLAVSLTYNGSVTAPTNVSSYAVVGTINDANYQGTASGTLVIAPPLIITHSVTPSAGTGGSINPATVQTVTDGNNISFTLLPGNGYRLASVSGCGGTLVDHTYTTGAITAACTVSANFASAGGTTPPAITPPAITLSALANGATSSTGIINISGTVTALNGLATLTINNAPVTVSSGSFSYPVTLVPGSNTITIIATDNAGLASTVSRSYTFDATAPLISLTSNLTDNSVTRSAEIIISGSVYMAGTTVSISLNGGTQQAATMTDSGFSLPVTLAPGLNTIEIIATDPSGKVSRVKLTITLHAALSLAVTTPGHDRKIDGITFTLSGMVDGAPPLTVAVAMDGQIFYPDISNGSFSQTLTFTTEKDYPVSVTASDTTGNSVTVIRNINFVHLGDFDANGRIELSDALKAYYISQGLAQPTATDLLRCDVAPLDADGRPQGDGIIDLGDVIILLRYVVGIHSW